MISNNKKISPALSLLMQDKIPKVYNWNTHLPNSTAIPFEPTVQQIMNVQLLDEGLRDGLHGISQYPTLKNIKNYLDQVIAFGISHCTVGVYPGKNNPINESIQGILRYLYKNYPTVIPVVLCLTTEESIEWLLSCKKSNPNIHALVFMGTSAARMIVEEWDKEYILKNLKKAITTVVSKYQIPVIGATEHTLQTEPSFLRDIIKTQVESGISSFCIADTVGGARPLGVYAIIQFVRRVLIECKSEDLIIEWHGHRDTGNELQNAMTAIAAGARRIHVVPRGIGERAGNTPMETVVINCLQILSDAAEISTHKPWNVKKLMNVLRSYDALVNNQQQHGVLCERAFTTSLGIHSAALYKSASLIEEARKYGFHNIADQLTIMSETIYSGISPHSLDMEFDIKISPWSGISTVKLYCKINNLSEPSEGSIQKILSYAKYVQRELSTEEIDKILEF